MRNTYKMLSALLAVVMTFSGVALAYSSKYILVKNDVSQVATASDAVASISDALESTASNSVLPNEEDIANKVKAIVEADGEVAEWEPSAITLNLTHLYPEGADESDPLNSYAAQAFKEVYTRDEDWYANITSQMDRKPESMANSLGLGTGRVMGRYDIRDDEQKPDHPETWIIKKWSNINFNMHDANGKAISGSSNAKEILAMANVYAYYHDWTNYEDFLSYANNLWKRSHSYGFSMGHVYYCDGCITEEKLNKAIEKGNGKTESQLAEEASLAEEAQAQAQANEVSESIEETQPVEETAPIEETTATEQAQTEEAAEAETASSSDAVIIDTVRPTEPVENSYEVGPGVSAPKCPGHIDLNVSATIYGFDGAKTLFTRDNIGNNEDNYNDKWQGWTPEMQSSARILAALDWYELYELSISSFSKREPLAEGEIENYLNELPEDLSDQRKSIIEWALRSVGNVPYYFGGKPVGEGYEANSFYTTISPDYKGRIFRGLDCSGWINWVYWSTTGNAPTEEGTAGLVNCGKGIRRNNLKPGDIIVRPGSEETIGHVIMFLKWGENGELICIHETGGPINNVAIGTMDAYWNYRNLLND